MRTEGRGLFPPSLNMDMTQKHHFNPTQPDCSVSQESEQSQRCLPSPKLQAECNSVQ